MKKLFFKVCLPVVCMLMPRLVDAQFFSGGLAGGVSTGSVKIEDIDNGFVNAMSGRDIIGYELGLYAKLKLEPFYIKPMALYAFREGNVSFSDRDNVSHTIMFHTHRVQFPVLFGLRLVGPLCVEGGPVYHYIISSSQYYEVTTATLGKRGMGYRIGGAADFGFIILNVSYEGITFKATNDQASFSEPNKIIFGAAIRLGYTGNEEE